MTPTLTISGISAAGTIALNDLYEPSVTEMNGGYSPAQTYVVPELTNSVGADVTPLSDPTHVEEVGEIAG